MNAFRRIVIAASMAAVCFMPTPPMHASTVRLAPPAHAYFAKSKNIQFSLRNDTGVPIALHAGDVVLTLDPGKTMSVKLPEGTHVMSNTETPKHKVGEVIVEVSSSISGATVAIS